MEGQSNNSTIQLNGILTFLLNVFLLKQKYIYPLPRLGVWTRWTYWPPFYGPAQNYNVYCISLHVRQLNIERETRGSHLNNDDYSLLRCDAVECGRILQGFRWRILGDIQKVVNGLRLHCSGNVLDNAKNCIFTEKIQSKEQDSITRLSPFINKIANKV